MLRSRDFKVLGACVMLAIPVLGHGAFFGAPSAFRLKLLPQLRATEEAFHQPATAVAAPAATAIPSSTSTASPIATATPTPIDSATFSATPTPSDSATSTVTPTQTMSATPFLASLGEVVGQPALTITTSSSGTSDPVAHHGPPPAGASNDDMIMCGDVSEDGYQNSLFFNVPAGMTGFRFKFFVALGDCSTRVEVYQSGNFVFGWNTCGGGGAWEGLWQVTPLPVTPGEAMQIRYLRCVGSGDSLPGSVAYFDDFVFTP